jgi:phosphatidyl-myo-inositol alpha-mannosyltransferase
VRIVLVCPYAWDDPGGVQTHVRELGECLRARGHDVIALSPVRRRASEDWVRAVGRPVDIRYNASNVPIDPRPWRCAEVRRAIVAFAPDVVHAHEPLAPSTSMWATLVSSAPVVGTFHSGATRSRLFGLAAPVLRRIARRITVRIAVSRAAAEFAGARIGGSFQILPNGIDVRRFERAVPVDLGPGVKLLFVGRLDPRKGFPTAVAAFDRLASTRPDLRLIVVGDGPDRRVVDDLEPAVRARVRLVGAIANVDLPPYHAASDLFLGTAVGGESFGVILVEAMAAGLPIVASRIRGYDEVIRDGVEGFLVPPRNPVAVAEAAGRILEDSSLAARMAAVGRERARAFDWEVVSAQLEDLYRGAIASGRPSLR